MEEGLRFAIREGGRDSRRGNDHGDHSEGTGRRIENRTIARIGNRQRIQIEAVSGRERRREPAAENPEGKARRILRKTISAIFGNFGNFGPIVTIDNGATTE
jgi:hypothetical protein